jgi:hypothetical protein
MYTTQIPPRMERLVEVSFWWVEWDGVSHRTMAEGNRIGLFFICSRTNPGLVDRYRRPNCCWMGFHVLDGS